MEDRRSRQVISACKTAGTRMRSGGCSNFSQNRTRVRGNAVYESSPMNANFIWYQDIRLRVTFVRFCVQKRWHLFLWFLRCNLTSKLRLCSSSTGHLAKAKSPAGIGDSYGCRRVSAGAMSLSESHIWTTEGLRRLEEVLVF